MKRLVFIISLIFMSSLVLVAQQERKVKANAEMAFEKLSHDYGSIVYAANGGYDFKFKNNSQKPIVVTNVKSSCGCTVPSWPKEPIQPGESGKITVKYNTKLAGTFNKSIQVFSTADNSPVKLSVRGKVNAKPSDYQNNNKNSNLRNGTRIKEGMGGDPETPVTKESKAKQNNEVKAAQITDPKLAKQLAFKKKKQAEREAAKKKK